MTVFRTRSTAAAAAVVAALLLVGCGNVRGESSNEPEAVVEPPVAEEPIEPVVEPTQEPVPLNYPLTTYSSTFSNDDGFSQTLTLNIGQVIPGSDPRALDAWYSVGGLSGGTPPCWDSGVPGSGNTNFELKSSLAGYAFGTVTITNDAPDFEAQELVYQWTGNTDGSAFGVEYSDSQNCHALYGGLMMNPDFVSANWGPVPVVVALNAYVSPAFPAGDPASLAIPLKVKTNLWGGSTPIEVLLQPFPG